MSALRNRRGPGHPSRSDRDWADVAATRRRGARPSRTGGLAVSGRFERGAAAGATLSLFWLGNGSGTLRALRASLDFESVSALDAGAEDFPTAVGAVSGSRVIRYRASAPFASCDGSRAIFSAKARKLAMMGFIVSIVTIPDATNLFMLS
jgi:hypothetical protein